VCCSRSKRKQLYSIVCQSAFIYLHRVAFIGFAQGQSACGSSCSASDLCCNDFVNGPACYDPSLYTCANGNRLCGVGEAACGSICYDPSAYSCSGGELQQGGTANPLFCSPFNFNPCEAGLSCCAETCFEPSEYTCLNGALCPPGNSLCGESQCFDPSVQECCNDQLYLLGTSVCSQSTAECCSCTCNPGTNALESYTVLQGQCSAAYINTTFGALECVGYGGDCGTTCVVSCGDVPMIGNYCYNVSGYGCVGNYICAGGPFYCSASSDGQCQVTVSETAHSTTSSIGTAYNPPAADYTGAVCCWCASENAATSLTTTVANCTAAWASTSGQLSGASECRLWSPAPATGSDIGCGYPAIIY